MSTGTRETGIKAHLGSDTRAWTSALANQKGLAILKLANHLQSVDVNQSDPKEAKAKWAMFRTLNGRKTYQPLLTPPTANMKLGKAGLLYGLSLAQARTSGVANTCVLSTRGCRRGCVAQNGNGRYPSAQRGRELKVRFLLGDPSAFVTLVASEVDAAYKKYGDELGVRLNTFSDLPWETIAPWFFEERAHMRFYDYTKDWTREPPANYHLTYSVSEITTDESIDKSLADGRSIAVVFDTKKKDALPSTFRGFPVVDGDKSDVRDRDPHNVVVGLRAKGMIRTDPFGMVRPGIAS
jgi:hypothetical protein